MTSHPPIDLTRYPIDKPGSPDYAAMVEQARANMAATGACVLEGFTPAGDLPGMVAEVSPHLGKAFYKTKTHNAWLVEDDPSVPADHPRNVKQTTTSATLGYDCIPAESGLNAIYEWAPFRRFVADVLGYGTLYPYDDALAPVNVLVYEPGTETGWHFDGARFTITLLLQEPEAGAAFEYAPFIRDADDDGYDEAGAVMDGTSDKLIAFNQPAGCLVLFRGSKTLHRVTPVRGSRARLVAVLSYSPEPGTRLNPTTQQTFYGRVA
jgi:hypothetical protein